MALRVADALRDGVDRLRSGGAVPVAVGYVLVQVLSTVAVQSQGAVIAEQGDPVLEDTALFPEGGPLALDLPAGLVSVLSLASIVLLSLVTVLALRSFSGEDPLAGGLGLPTLWGVVALLTFPLLLVAGIAALVVPAVLFVVTMPFVPAFVALDGDNLLAAMVDSWRLTRGNWLRMLLFVLAELAIVVGVALVGSIPAVAVGTVSPAAGTVVQAAFGGLSLTVVMAVLAAAFAQLREATEAEDEFADIDDELLP